MSKITVKMTAVIFTLGIVIIMCWQGSLPAHVEDSPSMFNEPEAVQPSALLIGVTDLLNQAESLRGQKRFREAEMLLTKATLIDGYNLPAWRGLVAVQRDMAEASLQAGNLLNAAQEADRARGTCKLIEGISVDPRSPSWDPQIVTEEDAASTRVVDAVRKAIDTASKPYIEQANECADEAYHRFWYYLTLRDVQDDREKVVEGLKDLRKVVVFGAYSSDETRMSANETLSKLKGLVESEEWNGLLARAGFDPTSRDTLKKWGLE